MNTEQELNEIVESEEESDGGDQNVQTNQQAKRPVVENYNMEDDD
jgi:hypothetical protein